ncbi:hypothetical protein B0H17DRAFT_952241 [Mycena rosella]|uniref:Uncharacterized protein n=1 Tax=Mycena rosella TaxID=1033263 RepID=A0AAD7G446_MYCRO|nr:hypothetical protein B0H17DRAFT_952241 [Mycena rosella]
MKLRGIVYGGQAHFTSRFIDINGTIWFHDGISTGRNCVPETNLSSLADLMALGRCGAKKAVAVIYGRSN